MKRFLKKLFNPNLRAVTGFGRFVVLLLRILVIAILLFAFTIILMGVIFGGLGVLGLIGLWVLEKLGIA